MPGFDEGIAGEPRHEPPGKNRLARHPGWRRFPPASLVSFLFSSVILGVGLEGVFHAPLPAAAAFRAGGGRRATQKADQGHMANENEPIGVFSRGLEKVRIPEAKYRR